MPTYEYQCQTCGCIIEEFQQITAPVFAELACPKCLSPQPVKRLIGKGSSLIFKGAGFYQTDYRSDSYKSAEKSESGSSTPAAKPAAETSSPASASAPASPTAPAASSTGTGPSTPAT